MKKLTNKYTLALSVMLIFGILNGCKNKNNNIPWPSEPVKMYTSDIKVDTVKLMNMLRSKLTPDSILATLGPGTHEFYLIVGKNPDADHLSYIFSSIMASNNKIWWKIVVNRKSNGSPFWYLYPDTGKIFRLEKDISNSDSSAIGMYALRFGVNNSKKVIYPWSFSPVDLSRYETKFFGNYTRSDFQGSPISRTIIGGDEELGKKIIYPEEAKKIGVSGSIMIHAFVDEKGNVVGTKLIRGIGFGCDEAALDAVKQVKFYPSATGKNVVMERFDFQVEDKNSPIGLTNTIFRYDPAPGYKNNIYFNIVNSGDVPPEQTKSLITVHIDKVFAGAFKIERMIKEQEFWLHWDGGRKGNHEYVITISPAGTMTWYRPNVKMGNFEVK
ncbi:MAG: energy transducer TonB [Ignavibacteriaceae bacterium]|nr:energy transducer TonB [Ignavibacteriaceae bacterium]